jgi:hypothetical protein
MKKQEMKNLILQVLGRFVSETDFRLKKRDDGFVRKIAGGRQMLGVPIWDYSPEFEFSLNTCIRLDAVEEIFHQFSGSPTKYHSLSFTTFTNLQYFTGGPAKYKVTTEDDVASAGEILSSVIRVKIIPFFNEYENIQALDKAVNCGQPGIDFTQNPSGAMHRVILAHLAGNADSDRLVAKYRSDMQLAPDAAHPFNRLVEYLKTH